MSVTPLSRSGRSISSLLHRPAKCNPGRLSHLRTVPFGRHIEVRAPGGVDGVPWFGVSGVSRVLLAIGAIADARSNHPRLLIVLGYQTAGRSKRQALADTGTGDDCVCSSAPMEVHLPISRALRRARSPIGGGQTVAYPTARPSRPSPFLVRWDLWHCHPLVSATDSVVLFARSTRPPKRTVGLGVACVHPRDRGRAAGRVDGAGADRRDWSDGPTSSAGDSPIPSRQTAAARTGRRFLMEATGFLRHGLRGDQPGGGPLRRGEFRRALLTIGRPSRQAVGP